MAMAATLSGIAIHNHTGDFALPDFGSLQSPLLRQKNGQTVTHDLD